MQNNPLYDPQFLAGLAMINGRDAGDAFSQAAITSHNMQQAQAAKMAMQREQFMAQSLPQVLQELQGKSGQEIFQTLTSLGMDAQTASVFAKNMAPAEADIKENIVFNPVTGEAMMKQISNGRVTGFDVVNAGGAGNRTIQNMPSPQSYTPGFEPPQRGYETPVESKERRKEENETLKGFQQSAISATAMQPTIDSLRESLKKFNTGTFAEQRKSFAKAEKTIFGTNTFGIHPEAAENIESKAAELVMPLVERNKGAASDADMELFLKSTPKLTTSSEGNKIIVDAAEALKVRSEQRFEAAKAYQRKFGTIDGFVEKWMKYVNENKILVPDEAGNPRLNRQNITNWKPSILGEANALSQDEIQRLMKIANGK